MDNERENKNAPDESLFSEDGSYRIPHPHSYYSDASFSPVGENSEPTRFYKPVRKTEKTSGEEKKNKEQPRPGSKRNGVVLTVVLCLLCACAGCMAGIFVMSGRYSESISKLEDRIDSLEEAKGSSFIKDDSQAVPEEDTLPPAGNESISPARIYADACGSVVGITSEITYTNFFGMRSSSAVSGTGFIISDDGYVITNYHVIESAVANKSRISTVFYDGSSFNAELVGADPDGDIAVLKIDGTACVPAFLGDSESIQVGDEIYAVGNPLGELSFTMTSGRVSALDRSISTDSNSVPINMFQIDAPVNSGNSGGPLYNDRGEVVGVVTAKYSSGSIEGIGFAIPINQVRDISSDLITKGYVTGKPLLGVLIDQRYTGTYSFYYNLPMGAFVNSVEKGSCADLSGIRPGDIILAVGNTAIEGSTDLQVALSHYRAGDALEITVYHNGQEKTVSVTLDENRGGTNFS